MRLFLKHARDPVCVRRAIKIALIIGTVHALLNHFDELIAMDVSRTNALQMLFTYFVPYTVATHGSAMQARHREMESIRETESIVATDDTSNSREQPPTPLPKEKGSIHERILSDLRLFRTYAFHPVCMKRAIKVALVVGSIIGLLNHFDAIIDGTLSTTNYVQIGITYTIPYIVNTIGSARQASHMEISSCSE